MSKSLALLALTLPAANAVTYSWTKGPKLCAGIIKSCTDKSQCAATAVGLCPGDAKQPKAYLESSFEGLYYIDSKKYLDPATGKATTDASNYKVVEGSGPGFRDYKADRSAAGGKFAYMMVGNTFGSDKAGGYAGLVSYMNTGTTTISSNTVKVFGAGHGDNRVDRSGSKATDWSDSDMGAPLGPYEVCISEIKADDKTCGAARSFETNKYKFSIFGSVDGDEYDAKVKAGANGFPAGMDKMGVRMIMRATGFAVKDLKVNGKSWDKSMVNEDVTSIKLMTTKTEGINIVFPKKYNTGTKAGAKDGKPLPNTATHDMHIRVSTPDADARTIMIDYLFDTSELKAGTWFIYDPDVTEVTEGSTNPNAPAGSKTPAASDTPASSATNTYTIAAATFSAVAAVVGLLM